MKNLRLILASALLATNVFGSLNAQVTENPMQENKSYWQLSARGGYDFPTYKEDFRFIDYQGGFMGGLSINKYWNWFGIEADADFIKNSPEGVDLPGKYFENKGVTSTSLPMDYTSFDTNKKNISRTFVGI